MFEPMESPLEQEKKSKIIGSVGETPFFMTATPIEDGEFLLRFRTGENIPVTKGQMIEMINQISLGLMLGN